MLVVLPLLAATATACLAFTNLGSWAFLSLLALLVAAVRWALRDPYIQTMPVPWQATWVVIAVGLATVLTGAALLGAAFVALTVACWGQEQCFS